MTSKIPNFILLLADSDIVADDDDDLEVIIPVVEEDEIKVLGTKRALEEIEEEAPIKKRRKEDLPGTKEGGFFEIETIDID